MLGLNAVSDNWQLVIKGLIVVAAVVLQRPGFFAAASAPRSDAWSVLHPEKETKREIGLMRPAGAAVAAVVTLAAGCASKAPSSSDGTDGGGSEEQFVVGYSQSNNAEPYRAQLNLQLQYFMKQHPDMKLLPIADAHQSSATQVSQVQNFIQQKVDVLIVSPNEPAPLTAAVQQACQAKIPVIILDRSVNTDCYNSFIGGDNYEIGKLAGQEAVKELPDGGNVVELRGILSDQPQIDRDKGFRDGIKANPKIKIIADREAKWLKDSAVPIMQQWLARFPKIDLVYGAQRPDGARRVPRRQGRSIARGR